jgi:hypothetical protein
MAPEVGSILSTIQASPAISQVQTGRIYLKKTAIACLNDIAWSEGSGGGVDAG